MTISLPPPPAWQQDASCAQVGTELADDVWFPEHGGPNRAATAICAACPVKAPCLAYGVATKSFGIWGGVGLWFGRRAS